VIVSEILLIIWRFGKRLERSFGQLAIFIYRGTNFALKLGFKSKIKPNDLFTFATYDDSHSFTIDHIHTSEDQKLDFFFVFSS